MEAKKGRGFLKKVKFSDGEIDIFVALSEYRYLAPETIFSVIDRPLAEQATALRRLQEFSCIERRENYCHIAPPLREAVRRDVRFNRADVWKQAISKKICEAIFEYKDDDNVSISILDSATLAAARGHAAPPFLSALILPSHLLRVARDHYDSGKRALCIEFCERAWLLRARLPADAQMEVLRLWGLSSIRVNDQEGLNKICQHLDAFKGRVPRRIKFFLEGFYLRVNHRLDEAEDKFLAAWDLGKDNLSINRELASLLAKQRRYSDAERYARYAYLQAPTNPFIIDVLAEVLVGRWQQGLQVDQAELGRVMADLRRYGDAPGSSFFLVRKAQSEVAAKRYGDARLTIDRAIEQTPGLLAAYFIRADVKLLMKDVPGAQQDVDEVNRMLQNAGGFSEGDEVRVSELELRIMIEAGRLRQAKDHIDNIFWLPKKVRYRISEVLARAISFAPNSVDEDLRHWALTCARQLPSTTAPGRRSGQRRKR